MFGAAQLRPVPWRNMISRKFIESVDSCVVDADLQKLCSWMQLCRAVRMPMLWVKPQEMGFFDVDVYRARERTVR